MTTIFLLLLQLCVLRAFKPKLTGTRNFRVLSSHLSKKNKAVEEQRLLELISSLSGRGSGLSAPEALPQKLEIESLISTLETAGLTQARDERLLNGCWKLLYTSTPGNTQSPIQRSLTGFDGVSIYQVINIDQAASNSFLGEGLPDVSNTVVFGDGIGRLRITALASTSSRKLVEPRVGDGTFFGLAPFGKSFAAPPRFANERIDFAFQEALFEFKEPIRFTIPYPVPFKLLGDEAKGFIDNTYYSSTFRIARGNKGTIFLLQKADVAKDSAAATATAKVFPPPLPFTTTSKKEKNSLKKKKTSVAILFPSQLGTVNDYDDFTALVEKEAGIKVYVSPLERLDWPLGLVGTFFTREFLEGSLEPRKTLAFYFKRVDEAVEKALAENGPDAELVLLSHSIGGWVARAWLSEWAAPDIKNRVKQLISLGSPHNAPPSDSGVAKVDQTRGLLTYINDKFPGAYERRVKYVSVIGRAVKGDLSLTEGERLLAFSSYSVLCGDGKSEGDGIIPIATARLEGAQNIIVDSARHSNFIPTPFRQSIFLQGAEWYGSPAVLQQWLPALKAVL